MKNLFASVLTLSSLALLAGCGDDDKPNNGNPDGGGDPQATEQDVKGSITGDTTWKAGTTYTLKDYVFVESGTLTIEPGVTIKGEQGSALVITREAKINAVGTA